MLNAVIEFEGNSVEISEFEHNKKRADVGDPNNTAFILRVECAAGFMGTSRYICDINALRRFILELDDLFRKKIISAKFTDQSLGSYIKFKMSSKEVFIVSGMSLGSDGEQILKYRFTIDRPSVFEFAKQLRELVNEFYGLSAT